MNTLFNLMLTIGQVAVILIAAFYIVVICLLLAALVWAVCTEVWAALRYRHALSCMKAQVDTWFALQP